MKTKLGMMPFWVALLLMGCGSQQEQTGQIEKAQQIRTEHSQSDKKEETVLTQADKDSMIAIFEQMRQAMIDKDMATLDAILPDDYVAVHITGRTQTKAEWLADIENGEMNYYDFLDTEYSFSQEGDRVLMQVKQRIHAKIYGSEGTWSVPGDRYFQKRDGKWQIIG
ncbi:nuclear transport factor 2 family protein [Streptococcus ovuberis]|uniref:Nuclear transport factor 2 family protein n=1 Tax=Streptococcus ovuberis TaxID=1936207 RepID=A0A7X6MYT5_9STRE|nr:nuclear transport factor 2 family protein [Streptococcus ovuberis]NKZ19886.1 nuclear transport factor 2 family protein [Streptococcus ovuberis]